MTRRLFCTTAQRTGSRSGARHRGDHWPARRSAPSSSTTACCGPAAVRRRTRPTRGAWPARSRWHTTIRTTIDDGARKSAAAAAQRTTCSDVSPNIDQAAATDVTSASHRALRALPRHVQNVRAGERLPQRAAKDALPTFFAAVRRSCAGREGHGHGASAHRQRERLHKPWAVADKWEEHVERRTAATSRLPRHGACRRIRLWTDQLDIRQNDGSP